MSVAPAMMRAPPSASNPSASSRSEGRAYMRAAHASDVCMQMIERIRRLVKDLCGFSTCQTLPAASGHLRQNAAGALPKDCLSLAPGVTKMRQTALTVQGSADFYRQRRAKTGCAGRRQLSIHDLGNSDRWWSVPATPGTN